MKSALLNFRYFLEYVIVVFLYRTMRLLPYGMIKLAARITGLVIFYLIPPLSRLVLANIAAAMPELDRSEARRIGRESCFNMILNVLEFFWLSGRPDRIDRWYQLAPEVADPLRRIVATGERILFVNPHLGSWEASALMMPYRAGVKMAMIAKPLRNTRLNDFLNRGAREQETGLQIIFSRGAIRAATRALAGELCIGMAIDQNTRVRDGGIFINFFGLPVCSSKAPVTMMRYCAAHHIPARIVYATSVRLPDGRMDTRIEFLSKPFEHYRDAAELIQEIMDISETYIRKYPEQYLWLYRRFRYIPPDCPEALKRRYPGYAEEPGRKFFDRQ
jgi:KDO2-lipid IV(A) lauroyltransferase